MSYLILPQSFEADDGYEKSLILLNTSNIMDSNYVLSASLFSKVDDCSEMNFWQLDTTISHKLCGKNHFSTSLYTQWHLQYGRAGHIIGLGTMDRADHTTVVDTGGAM